MSLEDALRKAIAEEGFVLVEKKKLAELLYPTLPDNISITYLKTKKIKPGLKPRKLRKPKVEVNAHPDFAEEESEQETVSEKELPVSQEKVLAVIKRGKSWFTDIADASGVQRNYVGGALAGLLRKGLIERIGNGRYALKGKKQEIEETEKEDFDGEERK